MNDPRSNVKTFYTSAAGLNITRFCSSVSAVSSALTIYIIFRKSKSRLWHGKRRLIISSVYNRIMFFVSVGNLAASLAMSLTTIPMPKDMIYTQFEGSARGNRATCTAQGLFSFFGTCVSSLYVGFLFIYYFCSMKYGMSDERFSKYLEPTLLHIFIFIICSVASAVRIKFKLFNPTPLNSFCWTDTYPYWCKHDNECLIRGNNGFVLQIQSFIQLFCYCAIMMAMIAIATHVYKTEVKSRMAQMKERTDILGRIREISSLAPLGLSREIATSSSRKEDTTNKEEWETCFPADEETQVVRRLQLKEMQYTKNLLSQCLWYFIVCSICFLLLPIMFVFCPYRDYITF